MTVEIDTSLQEAVIQDMWAWIRDFVAVPNEFYGSKFPPCPYAQSALAAKTVSVFAWVSGEAKDLVIQASSALIDDPHLTTIVIALPPRYQSSFGLADFIERLSQTLIPKNVFLNTGVAKTTKSRYPGSRGKPYFIVVANSLDAVLKGAKALQRTEYYQDWPASHFEIVVRRRERLARKYRKG